MWGELSEIEADDDSGTFWDIFFGEIVDFTDRCSAESCVKRTIDGGGVDHGGFAVAEEDDGVIVFVFCERGCFGLAFGRDEDAEAVEAKFVVGVDEEIKGCD